jgi:hypothetical protein
MVIGIGIGIGIANMTGTETEKETAIETAKTDIGIVIETVMNQTTKRSSRRRSSSK